MHPFYWYLLYAFLQAFWVCRKEYRQPRHAPLWLVPAVLTAAALAPLVSIFLLLQILVTVNNKKT